MQPLAVGCVASVVRSTFAVLLVSLALAGTAGSAEAPSTASAAEPARGIAGEPPSSAAVRRCRA